MSVLLVKPAKWSKLLPRGKGFDQPVPLSRILEGTVPTHGPRQVGLAWSAANAVKNAASLPGANAVRAVDLGKSLSGLFPFAGVQDRFLVVKALLLGRVMLLR